MGNDTSSVDTQKKPISRNNPNHGHGVLPSNARLMNTAIKQRLSKGTAKSTYNMKVVIRGDRQTGKSALFHRLEGGGFIKEHRITDQIQCSHVLWPYKTSDEMVNLEIWDVVDKAIVPTNIVDDTNGIVKPSIVSKNLLPADASTIDVYKGAHAVIFMVDPTRKWTLDYVKTNISEIPDGIDCIVLFGKKDLTQLWTLSDGEIEEFTSSQPKNVRSLQISLQDCYGMKELHSFFNVPFLRMKAKYLQQELARAEREYEQSKLELDIFINHQNYDEFLSRLRALKEQKKGKKAPSSPVTAPAPKVKQTVRSSKDLPLIQEQQQKEEQKKKEEEERKKEEKKKQENIDSFKPTGNLNDDFFADLGGNDLEDDYEDEDDDKTEEDFLENKPSKSPPIKMLHPIDMNEDDTEDHILSNGHKKEDDNTANIDKQNDDNHEPEDIENSTDDKIGFADHELDDPPTSNSIAKGNGHHIDKIESTKPDKMAYSRMPDLKMASTESKSNRKVHSLMKLQSMGIEESDSDEFDDEPLVFAAPKTITKPKSKPQQKSASKAKIVEKPLSALDLEHQNNDSNKNKEDGTQSAFDALMNDFNVGSAASAASPQSPKSVKSLKSNDDEEDEDEEELDEDALAKKRRKEEKKRRRKERKKEKKRKKKEKKKKKKKKREKEKDNDLVEYEDSDGNNSDDIVDIE